MSAAQNAAHLTEWLRALNQARSCLRDAEDEATNGLTANARFIDQRVTEAREAVDRVILGVDRAERSLLGADKPADARSGGVS